MMPCSHKEVHTGPASGLMHVYIPAQLFSCLLLLLNTCETVLGDAENPMCLSKRARLLLQLEWTTGTVSCYQ